jgi:hypothetical protein
LLQVLKAQLVLKEVKALKALKALKARRVRKEFRGMFSIRLAIPPQTLIPEADFCAITLVREVLLRSSISATLMLMETTERRGIIFLMIQLLLLKDLFKLSALRLLKPIM